MLYHYSNIDWNKEEEIKIMRRKSYYQDIFTPGGGLKEWKTVLSSEQNSSSRHLQLLLPWNFCVTLDKSCPHFQPQAHELN